MDLGRRFYCPNGPRAPSWAVDPRRQIGATGGSGTGGRVIGLGDGEAESSEGSVAVRSHAVEIFCQRTVEIEAGAGEGGEGPTIAPVEGEESAGFSGGGAGDGGFLDERDGGALLGDEVGRADANYSAAADDDSFRRMKLVHRIWRRW